MGADRLVNAVAGSSLTQSDVIIVDFGTATTFDIVTLVSGMPIYKGGIIAPGVNLSLEVLTRAASKLPKIDLSMIKIPDLLYIQDRLTECQKKEKPLFLKKLNYL